MPFCWRPVAMCLALDTPPAPSLAENNKKKKYKKNDKKWLRQPVNNKTYLCLWSNLRCYFRTYLTEPQRFVIVIMGIVSRAQISAQLPATS